MNKNIIIAVVLVILAGGIGFFAGTKYQSSQRGNLAQFAGGGNGQFRRFGGQNGQNFRPVRGTVLSVDDTGLTVKATDGSSKIVVVSSSTGFVKSDSAAKSDIKTGDTVMVIGTQNSDGSVTAQQVQINPQFGRPSPTATQ